MRSGGHFEYDEAVAIGISARAGREARDSGFGERNARRSDPRAFGGKVSTSEPDMRVTRRTRAASTDYDIATSRRLDCPP
jgi:hypothetical protein